MIGLGIASSLAGSGISALASKSAANQQQSAADKAAALQSQSAANSLAFQKSQAAQAQANSQPYMNLGSGATNRLGTLLGLSGGSQNASAVPASPTGPTLGAMMPQAMPAAPMAAQGGGMISVQAPDGSVQQKPANQAAYWTSKGGKIVGGGGNPAPGAGRSVYAS
jgi:hypothetical protein